MPRRALLRLGLATLPWIAGFLSLWLLESSRLEQPVETHIVATPSPTRLVIFWIDALAREEAEDPSLLPRMHERIARGGTLHGPVRACADAVSVPCFTAMITGVDRFSMFALGKNFGAQAGALRGSVLEALQKHGKRIGYLGVPMFKDTLQGLDALAIEANASDLATIKRGLHMLDAERLDVAIIHLHETDDIAHRLGPSSPRYRSELGRIDAAIDSAIDELRPSDTALIMGDHGHTTDGRHFAGLDVPTYAAYFGPLTKRTLARPFAMTDHGAIWARLFGLRFGARSWVDDYFDGARVQVPTELPALPTGRATPLWAALICLALGVATAAIAISDSAVFSGRQPTWLAIAGLFVVSSALGASWLSLRPYISFIALWQCALIGLLTGAVGSLLLRRMLHAPPADRESLRTRRAPSMFSCGFAAALCLALPTIYKYGGAFVALTWLGLGLLGLSLQELRLGNRRAALGIAVLFVPLLTVYNPAIRNFSLRWFPVFSETLASSNAYVCIGCLVVVVALVAKAYASESWSLVLAAALGLTFALLRAHLSPLVYLLPCTLAVPVCLAAIKRPALTPLAFALTIPALWFFVEGDPLALAPSAVCFVLWAALPRLLQARSPLFSGAVLMALLWATFWTSLGCRMTGITFNFFFGWLPSNVPVTRTWAPHGLYTLGKYLLFPLFGLLLAHTTGAAALRSALPVARSLVLLRLGLVLAFMSLFSLTSASAGPFLTADVVQELALWLIALLVLTLLPKPGERAEPERDAEFEASVALGE